MYPLKFEPVFKTKIWGGETIAPFKGMKAPFGRIGESWEVSAYPGSESIVVNGALAGRDLPSLVRQYKGKLVGEHVYAKEGDLFPLLVKFIEAGDDLSIQVHPDDRMAARYGHPKGKTEMWYVIDATEDAHLLVGLSREISPGEYSTRVQDGTITDVLASYAVKPGDVFFLPAGRIHALCSGCLVAEIQQTSDLTYRIFDYNRPGLDGALRELHTELAREAIDYRVLPDYRTHYESRPDEETLLVECPWFRVGVMDLRKPFSKDLSDLDSFLILMCLSGSGTLTDAEPIFDEENRRGPSKGHRLDIRQGETVLIPASSVGITLKPDKAGMKLLAASYGSAASSTD